MKGWPHSTERGRELTLHFVSVKSYFCAIRKAEGTAFVATGQASGISLMLFPRTGGERHGQTPGKLGGLETCE